jgi:hypothetical protein
MENQQSQDKIKEVEKKEFIYYEPREDIKRISKSIGRRRIVWKNKMSKKLF